MRPLEGHWTPGSLLKWDAVHQTQKKIAEAEGKRNIEGDHLQAVLQIVDLTAVRNREESQGHDLEISSFIHIRTRKGTGIDLAAAHHMDPSENAAVVDQEAEENHIGLRDQDQRAERKGHTHDLINVLIAEAVKGQVTEELVAGPVIKKGVKAEIKTK